MADRKVNLQLDEDLVRRARQQAIGAVGKSDAEVIEDALTVYLAERAMDAGQASGTAERNEAKRFAPEEAHALREGRNGG